jgi:hypothetical protein
MKDFDENNEVYDDTNGDSIDDKETVEPQAGEYSVRACDIKDCDAFDDIP